MEVIVFNSQSYDGMAQVQEDIDNQAHIEKRHGNSTMQVAIRTSTKFGLDIALFVWKAHEETLMCGPRDRRAA